MSGVLFTHSYFYRFDRKQWKAQQPYAPLGTIQAAAVVRDAGFDVRLFDAALKKSPDEVLPHLTPRPDYFVIYDDGFNYLTKMCLTNMRDAAFVMASHAKRAGCKVIINSSDSTDNYEQYLDHGVDFVVRGEGEVTLVKLLDALERGGPVTEIEGLNFREGSKTVTTPARPVMRDLDSLPMPAWDLVDVEQYRDVWMQKHGYFSMNIATTRGCPFKCNWCAKPIYGNRYNSRSPQHVVEEIAMLIGRYQVDHLWMCDDIFGLKPSWVQDFSDKVAARGIKFRYKIQSRVDLLLEADTVDALARSGAETVWVGAESGSQKILDAMDKGTTTTQIAEATALLKSKDIRVAFFLQFGYLGETRKDINETIAMVLRLMPDEIGISVSYPLPGTKFYEKVRDQLQEKRNWSDSDDLSMLFRSTYPAPYYKVLHRYVHNLYRVRTVITALQRLDLQGLRIRHLLSMVYHVPFSWLNSWRLQLLDHGRS